MSAPEPARNHEEHSSTSDSRTPLAAGVSARSRRLLSFVIGIWFGCILLVAFGVPSSFRSVDTALSNPPPAVQTALKALGEGTVRVVLRYQISEANRFLFLLWGWMQFALGVIVFGMLLFFTKSGRVALGIGGAMFLAAVMMNFVLVPRLNEISHQMDYSETARQEASSGFQLLHQGFTAFEGVIVVLGSVLLGLLLAGRAVSGNDPAHSSRHHDHQRRRHRSH